MTNEHFPINEAQIVALFVESVAYGVYIVTFAFAARILFFTKRFQWTSLYSWALGTTTIALATFTTFDVALGLKHCLYAFVYYEGPGGPTAAFSDISNWVNVMKTVNSLTVLLIGDGFLVYRCWVIYFYDWKIVIVPVSLWIGNVVCCAIIIHITATLRINTVLLNVSQLQPFFTSVLVVNLVINSLVTGLIAYRIWSVSKQTIAASRFSSTSDRAPSRLGQLNRVVIESGLLNLISVFIGFVTFLARSNAIYGVTDTINMVVGSAFNLIIIRIHGGTADGDSVTPLRPPVSSIRFAPRSQMIRSHVTRTIVDSSNPSLDIRDDSGSLPGNMCVEDA